MNERQIVLEVNGKEYKLTVKPNELLINVLRERLGLMGTKYGCGVGECGACTVLMDGNPVLSCQMLALSASGSKITTIEGIAQNGRLHPLQEAFLDEGAVQCGFCTPGMILSAKALLDKKPNPTDMEIKEAIRGNICRCTGYINILRAIKTASLKLSERSR
ncbi:MAG: (2Fe-2S)-binding protein [Spirochaetes bacterium]|nr:MAG: (2Fe-2S)-binding protein [Spirochaetota bacterium]